MSKEEKIIDEKGSIFWYKDGLLHREDGPAIELNNGRKSWWLNGKRHRIDGPAIENAYGDKYWYKEDKLHREDGPAIECHPDIECPNGHKEYWLNGEQVEEKDLPMNQWPKCVINNNGDKFWKNENKFYHRLDGPAIELANGDKHWYKNGKHHRENGPAIEYEYGTKQWYKNGLLHREDGPAIDRPSGFKAYYLYGNKVEEKDLPMNKKDEWPKCEINNFGSKIWKNEKGQYHREDGPAIEWGNGDKSWYKNGERHREDGPAVELFDGGKSYYLNGIHVQEKDLPMNKKEEWPKCTIDKDGNKKWLNENGQLHRIDEHAVEWCNGNKLWYINGNLHREDGPAIEYAVGQKEWWINGKRHREDGPAVEWHDGGKVYYLNGKHVQEKDLPMNKEKELLIQKEWSKCTIDEDGNKEWKNKGVRHRIDGPAWEGINGDKSWWINGLLHREDGPAVEWCDGARDWYINGEYHREDGPAIEGICGYKKYYLNGVQVGEDDLPINKKDEWPKCNIDGCGNKRWKNERGQYHREDGPAVEYVSGHKEWYKNGKLHREGGPAFEYANGDKYWYKEDKLHREDGPAIECSNGHKEYWLNGEQVEEKDLPMNKKEEWPKCTINEMGTKFWRNKEGEYHREDGPAIENDLGTECWYKNGERHREDGPAVEDAAGNKFWYINGLLHREGGPAREYADGSKEYWLNGDLVKKLDIKSNKINIVNDIKKASYRTISNQCLKLIHNSIISALKNKNIQANQIQAMTKFLASDVGKSFISFILGISLIHIPKFKENNHLQMLTRELRVESIAGIGTLFTNSLLSSIISSGSKKDLRIENISKSICEAPPSQNEIEETSFATMSV